MNDLEWLARNVHKWPKGYKKQGDYGWHRNGDGTDIVYANYDQWLAERARLQGKPSWDDAPEWAKFLAQDADGQWVWYPNEPRAFKNHWSHLLSESPNRQYAQHSLNGEVLGDWRDTLEKRPEQMAPPTHTNHRCVQVTTENQEWDEKGLPPVGWHGEFRHGGYRHWNECIVLPDNCVAIKPPFNEWSQSVTAQISDTDEFRFLRTKEQSAIKEIESIIYDVWDQGDDEASTIAKAIYERWVKNQDAAE